MLKVKAGEVDRLGLLFERYHRQLFGFFYRMTQERTLSEDMVQTVFYRMLKYRHTYRGEGKFTYWMYSLARNVHANQFRKANPLAHSRDLSVAESQADPDDSPHQGLERQEKIDRLQAAIQQLTPEKREALVLSRFQGLKYKEIAQITNSSETAIKTRIRRALIELKEMYNQHESY